VREVYSLAGVIDFDEYLNKIPQDDEFQVSQDLNIRIIKYLSRQHLNDGKKEVFEMGSETELMLHKCLMSRNYNMLDLKTISVMIKKPLFAERIINALDNRFFANAPFRIAPFILTKIFDQIKSVYEEKPVSSARNRLPGEFSENEEEAVWSLTQLFKLFGGAPVQDLDR